MDRIGLRTLPEAVLVAAAAGLRPPRIASGKPIDDLKVLAFPPSPRL